MSQWSAPAPDFDSGLDSYSDGDVGGNVDSDFVAVACFFRRALLTLILLFYLWRPVPQPGTGQAFASGFLCVSALNLLAFLFARFHHCLGQRSSAFISGDFELLNYIAIHTPQLPYFTTSVKKLFNVCGGAPFNEVVNDNVYVPAGVAPFGPCGKLLLHAADPSATSNNVANVSATRRLPRNVHIAPPKAIVTSSIPSPPPIPPTGATNPVAVVVPWQKVCIANATSVVPPLNVTDPGITLHVISTDDGTHPNCTVPVTPAAPEITNP
jgi:hypothetical protein